MFFKVWFSYYLATFDTFDSAVKNIEYHSIQSRHQISIWISIRLIKAKQIERRCLVSQRPIKGCDKSEQDQQCDKF